MRPPAMKNQIHHVVVGVDGDSAFAYEAGAKRALIIASSSVFDTREDAERHLAGKGPFKWCVAHLYQSAIVDDEGTEYVLFEARVTEERNRTSRWGSFEKLVISKTPGLDEKIRKRFSLEVFDTKRQAAKYMRDKIRNELLAATKEVDDWTTRRAALSKAARGL